MTVIPESEGAANAEESRRRGRKVKVIPTHIIAFLTLIHALLQAGRRRICVCNISRSIGNVNVLLAVQLVA